MTIPATNSAWLFSFVQPNGITNVGFRQGSPSVEPIGMSASALTISGLRRATYRVESLTNLVGGAWTPVTNLVATSQWHTVSLPPSDDLRVYRVVLEKD